MSAIRSEDRASLCSFTFVDGRRCRIPRRHGHPYLCTFHARKEAKIFAGEKVGEEIARYLSGEHVPAGNLCSALGRLFAALAHLGRSLVQARQLAQEECAIAFGPASGESVILRATAQPTPINRGQASPNLHPIHLPPKHHARLGTQTSPKIPSSPNHPESTLAKVQQNKGF